MAKKLSNSIYIEQIKLIFLKNKCETGTHVLLHHNTPSKEFRQTEIRNMSKSQNIKKYFFRFI